MHMHIYILTPTHMTTTTLTTPTTTTHQDLRALGFRPPDLRAAADSPVYANWVQHVRAWAEQGEVSEVRTYVCIYVCI